MSLHKNTSNFWIYYSDIFALSLITIALTGTIMIKSGKFSFKERLETSSGRNSISVVILVSISLKKLNKT
jgi:hypothetical protein